MKNGRNRGKGKNRLPATFGEQRRETVRQKTVLCFKEAGYTET